MVKWKQSKLWTIIAKLNNNNNNTQTDRQTENGVTLLDNGVILLQTMNVAAS